MDQACVFCDVADERQVWQGETCFAIRDGFPVSEGHTLLIPRRHVASWFEATAEEQCELMAGVAAVREMLDTSHRPDGYNVGFNVGRAAGQTVFHLHVHVIPRYVDDVPDPRGGVRHVLPGKGNYLVSAWQGAPHDRVLVRGEDDALLGHLRAHIDCAREVDVAVAFVLQSGVDALEASLRDLLARGGRLRMVTGDYLDVTDPDALVRLLDLGMDPAARLELRVFDGHAMSYHPKAYIFRGADGTQGGVAYVGSSNLSSTALRTGVEWNMRVLSSREGRGFGDVCAAFERLFVHDHTQVLDQRWVEAYRARRRLEKAMAAEMGALQRTTEGEPLRPPVEPHEIQVEALEALSRTRAEGNRAGLVVLATGLGKTWLAAFDSTAFVQAGGGRVLFVAHREEILSQALQTFRRVRPEARLGMFTGAEKAVDADVLFASVQALSRAGSLERFARDGFAYIVIDEFHHASARTYRKLIDWFDPGFLLCLTATPERMDGGDLLGLCQDNLVYRCDLAEGIRRGRLSPFAYFGVPDTVDYANIPWRNRRFDHEALEAAAATETRAQNALDEWRKRGGERCIAFCVGQRHADYMAAFFERHGVRAAAVHSGEGSAPRTTSLERLAAGDLDVVCSVDMFNEGVDVPEIDTVLMLRPTESRVLWLQQIGRGLRRREGKVLKVIDYIGNHRSFLMKPQALLGSLLDLRRPWSHLELREALDKLMRGELELPPGCSATYELEALDVLKALMPRTPAGDLLREYYEDYREVEGTRPTAAEAYRDGYNPRTARDQYGSWVDFVRVMGDVDAGLLDRHRGFLVELEKTSMTKSYKMLLLQAMIAEGHFPGEIGLVELAEAFVRLVRRSPRLGADVEWDLSDLALVQRMVAKFPIAAWTGGYKGEASKWFAHEGRVFKALFDMAETEREAFVGLVSELLEWRVADYLRRAPEEAEVAMLKVSHASGNPILFLDRKKYPWLPSGWTTVTVEGKRYELNFVKIAVNVAREVGGTGNLLPVLLRRIVGEKAGVPGTVGFVLLRRKGVGYVLEAS